MTPSRSRPGLSLLAAFLGWTVMAVMALAGCCMASFFGGSHPKAGAAISLIYLLGMALIWLRPETKGCPLPD